MKLEQLMPSTAKMELKHPTTGDNLGISINLIGQDSKVFRDKARAIAKEMSTKKDMDPLTQYKHNTELVACCIVGWNDEEAFGVYSPARALELISMDELTWIKEQVEEYIRERANFFRPASE